MGYAWCLNVQMRTEVDLYLDVEEVLFRGSPMQFYTSCSHRGLTIWTWSWSLFTSYSPWNRRVHGMCALEIITSDHLYSEFTDPPHIYKKVKSVNY